jgi:hypothetical protein
VDGHSPGSQGLDSRPPLSPERFLLPSPLLPCPLPLCHQNRFASACRYQISSIRNTLYSSTEKGLVVATHLPFDGRTSIVIPEPQPSALLPPVDITAA